MEVFGLIIIISFFFFFCPQKYIMQYFIIASLLLAALAFYYSPSQYEDLYYHYIMLDEFKTGGWSFILNTHWFERQPVFAIYVYFISLFPANGFLPAISIFLTYLFPFILIYKIAIKYNVKKIYIVFSFLFILCTMSYLGVMSGIRNMLAFSVFSYVLYVDLVEKKNKIVCFAIYIALCLLHTSVVTLVIFRLLLTIAKRKFFFIIIAIFSLLWPLFNIFIFKVLGLLKELEFFMVLDEQVKGYIGGGTQYVFSTASIRLISLVIILFCVILSMYMSRNIRNYPDKYFRYILLIIFFTAGGIFQYDIFVRMVCFLIFSSPFVLLTALSTGTKSINRDVTYLKMLLYVGLIFVLMVSLVFYTWSEYTKINFTF